MKLSEVSRTAVTTWCPLSSYSNYIAAGSIAGSLEDFTAGSKLEIFTTDPSSSKHTTIDEENDNKMLLGRVTSADRFNRLAWGKPSQDFELGVIAGALVDGSISLYDASKIVGNSDESTNAVITNLEGHTAPVKGLEFNPTQTNLLASAGEDSQLYIWNLKNPNAPTPVTLGGKNPHQNQSISFLSWNRIYEYILATTSYNGTSVVWDLKQKRPIVPFTNSQNKKRYSSLAWNPELSTQLVTASEDDNLPTIELWDLRKAYAPVREYHGHTKGVLSVSWCPDDSNLLVSCGKDNRTLIWNPNTGEILGELPTSNNWMYDVQWSKRPSILSTASFDGKISILSLQDSSASAEVGEFARDQLGATQTTAPKGVFKTAPKWLQRPAGAVFGFGGRLVHFSKDAKSKKVSIFGVSANPEISQRSLELEKAVALNELSTYCDKKVSQSENEETKAVWNIMKILFEKERSGPLLEYLGFNKDAISKEVAEKLTSSEEEEATQEEVEQPELKLSSASVDELIRRSVLVQNFEDAVNVALKAGRLADALILSTCGGASLWEKTKQEYFALQKRKDMKIIGAILNNKLDVVVQEADLANWKETLSVIASCQNPNQFRRLTDQLAQRLETENSDIASANLCYMLSGNVEKVVATLVQNVQDAKGENSTTPQDKLLDFVETLTVFKAATNTNDEALIQLKPEIASVFTEYAHLLSNQGQDLLPVALRYLNIIASGNISEETASLRFRVYNSVAQPFGPTPTAPFQAREPVQQQQQHQQHQPQRASSSNIGTGAPRPTTGSGSSKLIPNYGTIPSVPRTQPVYPQPTQSGINTLGPPTNFGTGSPIVPMATPISPNPPLHTGMTNAPFTNVNPTVPMGPPPTSGFVNQPPHFGAPPVTGVRTGVPMGPPPTIPTGPSSDSGFANIPPSDMSSVTMGPPPTSGFVNQPLTNAPPTSVGASPSVNQPPIDVFRPIVNTSPQTSSPLTPPPSTEQTATPEPPKEETVAPKVELPENMSKLVDTFQNVFDNTFSGNVPAVLKSKKRMIENGISSLAKSIADNNVSENLLIELTELANAIEANDAKAANQCVKKITEDHWEQSKEFIKGIKFLVSALKK